MAKMKHEPLRSFTQAIFEAAGASPDEARTVSGMLVDADLMGLSSHGVQRVAQYVNDIKQGAIRPGVEARIERRLPTVALVDGQWNFGQVVAKRATDEAMSIAEEYGLGCAIVRGCRHVGRLGAYTEMCAARGQIGLAVASGGKEGHWVAPFGGREGRLSTNPISFAVPTKGDPIVMDFSTGSAAEGKVRLLRDSHQPLPEPMVVNREGRVSCDPGDLYEPGTNARAGAILPFGGSQGYKGYGLGLMAQILATSLAGPIWASEGIERNTNGVWLLSMRVEGLMPADAFAADVQAMVQYTKSCKAMEGSSGVLIPGELEFATAANRRRDGVPIDDAIWDTLQKTAASLAVNIKDFIRT
jgi:uncharacterized oxidoreductase